MSNFSSQLDYGLAVKLREFGYRGFEMTYGIAFDWLASRGVVLWVETDGESWFYVCGGRYGDYERSWKDAANAGLQKALSLLKK